MVVDDPSLSQIAKAPGTSARVGNRCDSCRPAPSRRWGAATTPSPGSVRQHATQRAPRSAVGEIHVAVHHARARLHLPACRSFVRVLDDRVARPAQALRLGDRVRMREPRAPPRPRAPRDRSRRTPRTSSRPGARIYSVAPHSRAPIRAATDPEIRTAPERTTHRRRPMMPSLVKRRQRFRFWRLVSPGMMYTLLMRSPNRQVVRFALDRGRIQTSRAR